MQLSWKDVMLLNARFLLFFAELLLSRFAATPTAAATVAAAAAITLPLLAFAICFKRRKRKAKKSDLVWRIAMNTVGNRCFVWLDFYALQVYDIDSRQTISFSLYRPNEIRFFLLLYNISFNLSMTPFSICWIASYLRYSSVFE